MFKKRTRTEKDAQPTRRRSIPQIVVINALLGIKEDEVMVIPDSDISYGMVRVRVWQANGKLENDGQSKRLTTRAVREGRQVVATEVLWNVPKPK